MCVCVLLEARLATESVKIEQIPRVAFKGLLRITNLVETERFMRQLEQEEVDGGRLSGDERGRYKIG